MVNVDKLIDVLILFAKSDQEMSPLRINKLLYFIDKCHLRKYGRFVLGDRYYRLPLGQVPSYTYDLINDFFEPFRIRGKSENPLTEFFSREKKGKYNVLKLKKERSPDYLSESERNVIKIVLDEYGKTRTPRLVDIAHSEKTNTHTPQPNEIEISLFLDGLPSSKKDFIFSLLEIDRENASICKFLNK